VLKFSNRQFFLLSQMAVEVLFRSFLDIFSVIIEKLGLERDWKMPLYCEGYELTVPGTTCG
jgi:hypothetical protein